MKYLDDEKLRKRLKTEYIKLLDTKERRDAWEIFRDDHPDFANEFSYTLKQILVADFPILVQIYNKYENFKRSLSKGEIEAYNKGLEGIFNYSTKGSSIIHQFFRDHADDLDVYTCFYCDMEYINAYTLPDEQEKDQFEIDHLLDKGSCPIISLSLFDFVPSCNVCNSRIKGKNKIEEKYLKQLSPTCQEFCVDRTVKIELMPCGKVRRPFLAHKDDYRIEFDCHKVKAHQYYINFFHLDERYDFHRIEALRIEELKMRYPQCHINKIARELGYQPEDVKEDIFGLDFSLEHHRCFQKLRYDIYYDGMEKR